MSVISYGRVYDLDSPDSKTPDSELLFMSCYSFYFYPMISRNCCHWIRVNSKQKNYTCNYISRMQKIQVFPEIEQGVHTWRLSCSSRWYSSDMKNNVLVLTAITVLFFDCTSRSKAGRKLSTTLEYYLCQKSEQIKLTLFLLLISRNLILEQTFGKT